ncbi:helix-turn-helix domain-containing protein [Rhizobiaceae bacterium BDR2-2]|uniref:Helix-turn-helix domain-containing protein n=1 Tax=Ectorhizobium quercum TaxID=2965071 RepID=A0AAE3N1X4_9HYPH|nr:helix-turn-helix transcriptional regulator [Ectorhizobium quercum]MCX8999483.1 helix-turn-helix domain-containing protein [Ectorhizobium quercum]
MTTPFGETVRRLREQRGVTQKQMAEAIGVSPAYLSALEHGKRGKPSFDFLQRVAGYFNVIWDEAEELFRIAARSDPRVTVDTSGLPAAYTALANRIAREMRQLPPDVIAELDAVLEKAAGKR